MGGYGWQAGRVNTCFLDQVLVQEKIKETGNLVEKGCVCLHDLILFTLSLKWKVWVGTGSSERHKGWNIRYRFSCHFLNSLTLFTELRVISKISHFSYKASQEIPLLDIKSHLRMNLNRRQSNIYNQTFLLLFSSVAQSCPTLFNPMNHSTPGLPVHHQLLEFTQTHVHRVGDAIQPSHPLSSPSLSVPNPSQHQGLFQWVNSSHEAAKVLEFQLHHQSFQWTPRTDLL